MLGCVGRTRSQRVRCPTPGLGHPARVRSRSRGAGRAGGPPACSGKNGGLPGASRGCSGRDTRRGQRGAGSAVHPATRRCEARISAEERAEPEAGERVACWAAANWPSLAACRHRRLWRDGLRSTRSRWCLCAEQWGRDNSTGTAAAAQRVRLWQQETRHRPRWLRRFVRGKPGAASEGEQATPPWRLRSLRHRLLLLQMADGASLPRPAISASERSG